MPATPAISKNPVRALRDYGQSVWLDYLRRSFIIHGELKALADEDGVCGVTANPSIFEKAIAGSTDYAADINAFERRRDVDAKAIYEHLAIADIQMAADVLRPVYEATDRLDGLVSIEVSPRLAHDTAGTVEEARRLWQAIGHPNVMIKVPGTAEGMPAITQLIADGINVNVTLLFARDAYQRCAEAYMAGLEHLLDRGADLSRVCSVASFFVSRIDVAADKLIAERLAKESGSRDAALLRHLSGKVAIANAKLAYQLYKELVASPRWKALAAAGGRPQRVLWASTGTKNPALSDVLYLEELIGADTVTTVPPATLAAFRDHGRPRPSLEDDVESAHDTLDTLEHCGISLHQITEQLLQDGLHLFDDAFDKLLAAIGTQREAPSARIHHQQHSLPADLGAAVIQTLDDWRAQDKVRRLWAGDASLWTGVNEARWLGWLSIADDEAAHLDALSHVAAAASWARFSQAVVLGMGGSSLCPWVMARTFGRRSGYPELLVLDSIDPAQIMHLEQRLDLRNALFIVSSKSGTTLEPNLLKEYFFGRLKKLVEPDEAASHFIAITDPGSKLQAMAEGDGFRHVFFGSPTIGGRYSALSHFGMVPAAAAGVDVRTFLDQAAVMVHACAPGVPPEDNPGMQLGAILGTLALKGRDKVTVVTSPAIAGLGAWLEQLLAESTGKEGKGLIPVDGERLGPPEVYGQDRVFVYIRLERGADPAQDAAVDALEKAVQPVVRIAVADAFDLGQEFFRWEFATAVAGSVLGVNAFNQPDVEASKVVTRKLTAEYERSGSLPAKEPLLREEGISVYASSATPLAGTRDLASCLETLLSQLRPGDYFGLLAYVEMNPEHEESLQRMRHTVRDAKRVATCLGFGPRFLHSTGQAYKGGPNTGVFLQITCDNTPDLPVPGRRCTFGAVNTAEALGDFQVLNERGRRALRVHLADVGSGLAALEQAMQRALT